MSFGFKVQIQGILLCSRSKELIVAETREERLRVLENLPRNSSIRGVKALKEYLKGNKLSKARAIDAKCADCSGYYVDGKVDCEITTCPLYPYMLYRAGGVEKTRKGGNPSWKKGMKKLGKKVVV